MKWAILLTAAAVACGPGSYAFKDTCVVDIQPIAEPSVKPSDEKPPTDKMPSYQREGITVITVPELSASDAKADREKAEADQSGKRAAGIERGNK